MSFSSEIKDELVKIDNMSDCCVHAMAYGMLMFGRAFSANDISLMTDNERVANKYVELAKKACSVEAELTVSSAGKYTVGFSDEKSRKKVLSVFSCTGNEPTLRIERGNLANDNFDEEEKISCCDAAFLRGAFLSCGTACDPNKSYHLEFVVPFKTLSFDLLKLLNDYGIKAKHMVRRFVNVIYIKESESIEDLLTAMGAQNASLEIMGIKVYKDMRNYTNRRSNFENANYSKTLDASMEQIDAIEKLKMQGVFGTLSEDLKQVANLRLNNREATLREIGSMCVPAMSRSAVNHRLKKLVEISLASEKEQGKLCKKNAEK